MSDSEHAAAALLTIFSGDSSDAGSGTPEPAPSTGLLVVGPSTVANVPQVLFESDGTFSYGVFDDYDTSATPSGNRYVAASETHLAQGLSSAPYLIVHQRDEDGQYRLVNVVGKPAAAVRGLAFSPDGQYLVATSSTTSLLLYKLQPDGSFDDISSPTASAVPASVASPVFFEGGGTLFCAVPLSATPFVNIFTISGDTWTKLSDPASLPGAAPLCAAASPDGGLLVLGLSTTPFIKVYTRSATTFTLQSDPANLPAGAVSGVGISGSLVVTAHSTTPFATFYSYSGGTLTKITSPSGVVGGTGDRAVFNDDLSLLVMAGNATPFLAGWHVSGTTLTYDSDLFVNQHPSGYSALRAQSICFIPGTDEIAVSHPQFGVLAVDDDGTYRYRGNVAPPIVSVNGVAAADDYVYVLQGAAPFLSVYRREGDQLVLLPSSVLSTAPTGASTFSSPAISPDGTHIAVSHANSPYITVYTKVDEVWTKMADPVSVPGANGRAAVWEGNSTIHVGRSTTPFLVTYDIVSGVLTRRADAASLPPGQPLAMAYADGTLAIACATTPFLAIYSSNGSTLTKLTGPASGPTGSSLGMSFSTDGEYLAYSSTVSPYLWLGQRQVDGTFEKIANPSTMPAGGCYDAKFVTLSDGFEYLLVGEDAGLMRYIFSEGTATFVDRLPPNAARGIAYLGD